MVQVLGQDSRFYFFFYNGYLIFLAFVKRLHYIAFAALLKISFADRDISSCEGIFMDIKTILFL